MGSFPSSMPSFRKKASHSPNSTSTDVSDHCTAFSPHVDPHEAERAKAVAKLPSQDEIVAEVHSVEPINCAPAATRPHASTSPEPMRPQTPKSPAACDRTPVPPEQPLVLSVIVGSSGRAPSSTRHGSVSLVETDFLKRRFRMTTSSFFDITKKADKRDFSPCISDRDELDRLVSIFQREPLLESLPPESNLHTLVSYCDTRSYKSGQTVFSVNDLLDSVYIQKSGSFTLTTIFNETEVKESLIIFGILHLIHAQESQSTLVCDTDGELYLLNRVVYQRTMMEAAESTEKKNVNFIDSVPILAPLTKDQRVLVANALQHKTYYDGELIIKQGDIGDAFYIIEKGMVRINEHRSILGECREDIVVELLRRKEGDYFGERALLKSEPRNADVAEGDVTCLILTSEDFHELLGGLLDLLDQNNAVRMLQSVELFKPLAVAKLFQLACVLTSSVYKDGDVIISQGSKGEHFYIVKEGRVRVIMEDNGVTEIIGELMAGEYFGEGALLTNDLRRASVIAVGKVTTLALNRSSFDSILGPLKQSLIEAFYMRKGQKTTIEFKDLQEVRLIGAGSYGTVKLVRHVTTGMTYALKQMLKSTIVLSEHQTFVLNEKRLLQKLNHPFIVNLIASFSDSNSVYMLSELCLGGELYTYMRDIVNSKEVGPDDEIPGCFPLEDTKFYTANIICALEYIHGFGICHRDIKPENLLFTNEGYIKIADFGFAKEVKSSRTYSLCGTPEYTAPEVYRRSGHGVAVDYWALGVLLYEMSSGFSPFHVNSSNPWDCFIEISRYTAAFPHVQFPSVFSDELKNFLLQLLNPNPYKRIGSRKAGVADIKNHPFYASLDWDKLMKQAIKSPYQPDVKGLLDFSNFSEGVQALQTPPNFNYNAYDMSWANEF